MQHAVQLVAYGGSVKNLQRDTRTNLKPSRGVLSTLLGVFACFIILSERGIARLLRKHRRLYDGRRRSIGGLAGMYAGGSLALGDEVGGALVGNNLKIIGTTGV